ncbi:unnamed protein product [Cyclocybe aegerita]|uniref:Reverse transcriptase domain-containing protein n=1 Tax=Cyclocybe aegerita TaxID=1973307 RepID=A0A8S0XT71_CYCAE|nr:unnamed protein product [Cyclocybe aegerita]
MPFPPLQPPQAYPTPTPPPGGLFGHLFTLSHPQTNLYGPSIPGKLTPASPENLTAQTQSGHLIEVDYDHGESSTAISLQDTASQIGLEWERPSNHRPMRISPNPNQRSNVLDLVFLAPSEILISMPRLEHDLQGLSDHVPICTDLDIGPEPPGSGRRTIKPGSEAEKSFISDILRDLAAIPVAAPATKDSVEALADAIVTGFLDMWLVHSTASKPTKWSKSWWTDECLEAFGVYQLSCTLADYNKFKKVCKDAKRDFFDEHIAEIATSHKRPWDLMEWVKQRKLPPCEAIRNGNQPCHDMDDLWDTLHGTYNSAWGREYDASVLDELPDEPVREWADFSEHELLSALKGCSNSSAPGPDHVTWVHLKELLKDKHVLALFIVLANACLQVGHWPRIFKELLSVIIPKLNKPSYAVPKAFRPIALLITFVKHDIFHPNQLSGIRQRSTEDAGLILTHLMQAEWVKGLQTSTLAFDIMQFFPSINHEMFMAVYCWNTFQSDPCSAGVGVRQGSALSPVISGLFIAPVMKLFYIKAAPLNTTLLSFVDDGAILAQSKQLDDNNVGLRKAYKIIYLLFVAFTLVLEHDKTELFHFSCRQDAYNPSLDLGYAPHTSAMPLKPKTYWRYLGFYFDRRLTFHEHIHYYATKAFTTVQAMHMLGNSTRGLLPKQRHLLYRSCVVPIATYGYCLWYFDGACNKGTMNQLKRMQRKAALWITGAFHTSPTGGLEALAGLIPFHLMLKKLATRTVYCIATLSDTHPLCSMMGERLLRWAAPHACSAVLMTPAMRRKVKSTVMEVDERVHTLTESLEPFAPEARPGDQLLDRYADRLHFDEHDPTQDRRPYLDELIANARANPLTVLAAADGSVPQSNQYQATSAAIIYKGHCELERTRYVSGTVTALDADLNAIMCAVCLAVKQANCQHIMVFTDSMGSAHRVVDPSHTLSDLPPRGQGMRPPGAVPRSRCGGGSGSTPPAIPPSVAGSSSLGGDALPISPDPTSTRATYSTIVPSQSRNMSPCCRSHSTTGSTHLSEYESDSGTAQPHQEMEVEGDQGGEEVLRDPSIDLLLGQYALKFRDTVKDLPGDLEVLTTSIAKATDWVLQAAHHNPLSIDGGDVFAAQMMAFVSAIMSTDFGRICGQGDLAEISLASMLEAETSSREDPTIHPTPVFRLPPIIDDGVEGNVPMQALDDIGCLASPPRIPASKKRKGVDRLVPPSPQKKSKVAYSCPGPPPPINHATKPKPRPMTWAGIARQAAPMPPLPPGLGPQCHRPSPPPAFPMGLMKTSPHRSVPSFTSEGPTQKQVLVSFGGTPPDLMKFFTKSAVHAANGYLRYGRSMLKVTSIICAYDGFFICESLPMGTPFKVALPSSTSFIKILDVPYFDPKGLKITQEALEKALRTSVHAEVFAYLSTKPRIDHNSAHSTSCTIYCNLWDSQQGTRAKKALGQPIFLAGRSCAIRPTARHTGVPLCQRCWKWGHPTVTCKAKQLSCPICSGLHEQKEHRQHAGCCKGNAKAKPPVPPTPRDQPCPHKGRCVNCHKDHAANLALY